MNRLAIFVICVWFLLVSSISMGVDRARVKTIYPHLNSLFGKVEIRTESEEKYHPGKVDEPLVERASLRTGAKSQAEIHLGAEARLVISENSQLDIPIITWGEGEVSEVQIVKGRVFYVCEKDCHRSLVTPLSSQVFHNGEFWLEYVPESPHVELFVLHGAQEFGGLENEESRIIHGGEKVVFQGVKENEGPGYDILLHGKKVARGKLQPTIKIADLEYKKLVKQFELEEKRRKAPPPKVKIDPLQICRKPMGKLNQCHWHKNKKGYCIRQRCNANGVWSEEAILPGSCQKTDIVAPCDY